MNILKEFTVNRINQFFIFLICIGLSSKAYALFMLEPHISNISGDFSIVSGSDGNLTGTTHGLRVGYLGQYFMCGLNMEKGHFKYDSEVSPYGNQYFTGGGFGTFIGFHFLDHWRLWTGYLNSALEPVSKDDRRYFGQQASFGLGYRVIGGWMVNYEYFNNYFTQYEDDLTGKTGSLENNIRVVGQSLSLSFIAAF